jgi:hypothetical protein
MTSELRTLDETDQAEASVAVKRFEQLLGHLTESADGAVLLSQDRCVDSLLDLYNAAPTNVVRLLVAELLDKIRHVSAVRADDLQEGLGELGAAIAVELAFNESSAE